MDMDPQRLIAALMSEQGLPPYQTPPQGGPMMPLPVTMNAPVPPDPPMRVNQETASAMFKLHDDLKRDDPDLARRLWPRIQQYTGDF